MKHHAQCTLHAARCTSSKVDMQKRMTITLDETVYDGLMRVVGRGKVSQFLESLARPHVLDASMDDGYRAISNDTQREASEWINGLIVDTANAAR